jgi:transcriptional regulator with XRE-family HTH domain
MSESVSIAIHTQIANALRRMMKRRRINQSELARRMRTSRAVVHRMLNPNEVSLSLSTLARALASLKCSASIRFKAAG